MAQTEKQRLFRMHFMKCISLTRAALLIGYKDNKLLSNDKITKKDYAELYNKWKQDPVVIELQSKLFAKVRPRYCFDFENENFLTDAEILDFVMNLRKLTLKQDLRRHKIFVVKIWLGLAYKGAKAQLPNCYNWIYRIEKILQQGYVTGSKQKRT